jgi:hypothetical protein
MTIVINDPETETRIENAAALAGIPVEEYVLRLLVKDAALASNHVRSLHELRGLHASAWRTALAGQDAQDFVRSERADWDDRP